MFRKVVTTLDLKDQLELKKVSAPFPPYASWTDKDRQATTDLYETFDVLDGYGLAAPQIGIHKRAIVVNLEKLGIDTPIAKVVMINPALETWGPMQKNEEACFSVPHVSARVNRPTHCKVTYQDLEGNEKVVQASGYASACLQHEVDHLDGVLYIDRLPQVSASMLLKKSRKIEKKRSEARNAARVAFEREHSQIMGDATTTKRRTSSKNREKIKARRKKEKQNRKRNRKK